MTNELLLLRDARRMADEIERSHATIPAEWEGPYRQALAALEQYEAMLGNDQLGVLPFLWLLWGAGAILTAFGTWWTIKTVREMTPDIQAAVRTGVWVLVLGSIAAVGYEYARWRSRPRTQAA